MRQFIKKGTDKFITELGNSSLYVLPYQHYLDPIENFFNQLKHYMRDKVPMNEEEVIKALNYSLKRVKKQDLSNYFTYAYEPKEIKRKGLPVRRAPKKKYKEADD